MSEQTKIVFEVSRSDGVATILFGYGKVNSLPGKLLRSIAGAISELNEEEGIRVIVLKSEGERAFCAGADFGEFEAATDAAKGKEFFMGFALVIEAIQLSNIPVIARVQGPATGGAVGIIAACHYAIAIRNEKDRAVALTELSLGIAPNVIATAVIRAIGEKHFLTMSLDRKFRSSDWAERVGLFAEVVETEEELEAAVAAIASGIVSGTNPDAVRGVLEIVREETEFQELDNRARLERRAGMSGEQVRSAQTAAAIARIKSR